MLEQITYDGFSGGLCTINSGEKCLPNQLQEASNVIIKKNGVVAKRHCSKLVSDFGVGGQINAVSEKIGDSYYASTLNKIYSITPSASVVVNVLTKNASGRFVMFDSLVYTNGEEAMIVVGVGPVLGSPLSKTLVKHNDRAFCSTANVLYETAPGTYPSSDVDNFATGASWTIGESTSHIVGLIPIGKNLLIFKEKEIFVQYGYTKNERQTQLLTKNYGSLSPFSIKSANIQGFGDCAIFLSDKKRLCIANLNGVVEIGDNVQDRLDTIALADEPVALIPTRHSARAGISDDGYYVLGYSDYALNAAPFHFNKAICVNIKDGLAITEWMSHTENTPTGYSNLPFFRFAEKGLIVATLDYKVASLSVNNDTDSNYAGTVNKFVPTRIKTRNENCGDTRFFKDWYFALITVLKKNKDTTPVFFPIKITQEIDYDLTKYEIDPVNNLPPVVYKEAVETGSASETMTYLFEIQHSIVGSGQQTCIVIENYLPATAYDVIELFGIKLLFNKVNAA